jgi:hypothetical protein
MRISIPACRQASTPRGARPGCCRRHRLRRGVPREVASGCTSMARRCRSEAGASNGGGRSPLRGYGVFEPVSHRRCNSRRTRATLTENRTSICSRVPSPRSCAATAFPLRSIGVGFHPPAPSVETSKEFTFCAYLNRVPSGECSPKMSDSAASSASPSGRVLVALRPGRSSESSRFRNVQRASGLVRCTTSVWVNGDRG